MNEGYGSDFISISDDEGNDYELEHLDTIEIDGIFYLAFVPADISEEDERYGLIIMKKEESDGEEYLVVPEEDELNFAYEKFMEQLFSDASEDENLDEE